MENNELLKQWYVVNTYSGHENTVKDNLARRVETMGMRDYILNIVVAQEEVPVLKDGLPTGKTKIKNPYPGYVFVEMVMSDEAWFVIRNTPGVTGFVGSSGGGTKPFPVPREQIDSVLKKIGIINLDMYDSYVVGSEVRILKGPLSGATGTIVAVDQKRGIVKVSAIIFSRVSIVEVDFADVEKIM